jgi:two-component system heavy metal sensor histidine kinase CusS
MARMVSDMLFLARSDQGLAFLDCEDVELGEEVRSLFDFYDALAEEKQVRLVLEGSASAHCDRGMLRRAIGNLLSNGIRHSRVGEAVTVRIAQHAQAVALTVENDGDGIPPEHLPRLFDRFYRIDPSRRAGEGTGLGLAITRAIIRAHGGHIAARSEGKKAIFEVQLPHISKRFHAHSWLPTPIARW